MMAPGLDPSAAPEVVVEDTGLQVVDRPNPPEYLVASEGYYPVDQELKAEKSVEQTSRRYFGLSRRALLGVIIALMVIIGGALAGGIAGGFSARKKTSDASAMSLPSSSLPTASPSSTSQGDSTSTLTSTSTSAAITPTFSSGCKATDGQLFTPLNPSNSNQPFVISHTTLVFQIHCNLNIASSSSGSNPGVKELQRIANLTSLDDCTVRCATYNSQLPDAAVDSSQRPAFSTLCSHIVYTLTLAPASPSGSMCYLQSGSTENTTNVTVTGEEADTAVLQWPM